VKPGDYEYDQLVNKLLRERRLHKSTTMTEAETQAEIERIQDGAKSSFEGEMKPSNMPNAIVDIYDVSPLTGILPKKRRGRPPGSRNKPKLGTP